MLIDNLRTLDDAALDAIRIHYAALDAICIHYVPANTASGCSLTECPRREKLCGTSVRHAPMNPDEVKLGFILDEIRSEHVIARAKQQRQLALLAEADRAKRELTHARRTLTQGFNRLLLSSGYVPRDA